MTVTGNTSLERLIDGVRRAERRAVAQAISLVENGRPGRTALLRALYVEGHQAWICGITGPPGAGKSTLVERIAGQILLDQQARLGVVCVDPSSPFTGGALLGDRIRMPAVATDPRVFIRSMASRGSRGGLARAAREAAVVLGAGGSDPVLLETVGVGQIELDVAETADTVLVVLVPESGDGIQALKAGVMEIGDVFVINKADRQGAEGLRTEIRSVLGLRRERGWSPPVLTSVATTGEGVEEVHAALLDHRSWLIESGEGQRRRRARALGYVQEIVQEALARQLWKDGGYGEALEKRLDDILEGRADPFGVAEEIMTASGIMPTVQQGESR